MRNTLSLLCAFLCIGAVICTTESKAVDLHPDGFENITEFLIEKIKGDVTLIVSDQSKIHTYHGYFTSVFFAALSSVKLYQDKKDNFERTFVNLLVSLAEELLDTLKEVQEKIYVDLVSESNCSMPLVPRNGGLVCAYLDSVYYCKPMCNKGYDFSFLRRSRPYEECGKHTGYTWTSQYVSGQRLAECIESQVAVSGVPTAYFNHDKCQNIVSIFKIEQHYVNTFLRELKKKEIENEHDDRFDFVVCGN